MLDNKNTYFWKTGPQKTRLMSFIALCVGVLTVFFFLFGALSATGRPITELPLIKMTIPDSEIEKMEDKIDDLVDELDDAIEDDDDDKIEEIEEDTGMPIEKVKKHVQKFSLRSLTKLSAVIGNNDDTIIFPIFITVISIYTAVLMLLMALAVFFSNRGLVILPYVLAIPFFIFLSGFLFFFFTTALCVAYIVLLSLLKDDYKNYTLKQTALAQVEKTAGDAPADTDANNSTKTVL